MHVFLSMFPWFPPTAALFNHRCPLPQAKGLSAPDARGCWEKPGSQGQGVCWRLDPCLKGLFDILLDRMGSIENQTCLTSWDGILPSFQDYRH